jgi:hypothetical protein
MHWGLSRGQAESLDQGDACGWLHHFYLYTVSALHEPVENTATATRAKAAHTKSFVRDYQRLPPHIQRRFDGALGFLLTNHGHPSLHAKKMEWRYAPEGREIMDPRETWDYRFIFAIEGDTYILYASDPMILSGAHVDLSGVHPSISL